MGDTATNSCVLQACRRNDGEKKTPASQSPPAFHMLDLSLIPDDEYTPQTTAAAWLARVGCPVLSLSLKTIPLLPRLFLISTSLSFLFLFTNLPHTRTHAHSHISSALSSWLTFGAKAAGLPSGAARARARLQSVLCAEPHPYVGGCRVPSRRPPPPPAPQKRVSRSGDVLRSPSTLLPPPPPLSGVEQRRPSGVRRRQQELCFSSVIYYRYARNNFVCVN
jgi:hypothetical protein